MPFICFYSNRPVCLPASASEKPATGTDIEIAGWGLVDNNNDSKALKKVQYTIMAISLS
jgi:hypothetical protein